MGGTGTLFLLLFITFPQVLLITLLPLVSPIYHLRLLQSSCVLAVVPLIEEARLLAMSSYQVSCASVHILFILGFSVALRG